LADRSKPPPREKVKRLSVHAGHMKVPDARNGSLQTTPSIVLFHTLATFATECRHR
jgi:hypothetical protein